MLKSTIDRLEQEIKSSGSLDDRKKEELLRLLYSLDDEVSRLSEHDEEQARSIAGFTQLSTHEATREQPDRNLLSIALNGLETTVEGFESSHPRLTEIVNSICMMLANIGI